jgi:multimeric flavodoxin WrbA/putative sterol carrier protein
MTLNITIPVLCMGLLGGGGMKFLIPFLSRKLAFVEKGQPKEYLKTARDAIFGMPFIFNPKAAKSWEFVLQFDISGDENFNAYLEIEKGKCTCKEGIHKSANMTIKSPAKVWLDIAKGNISGEVGFLRRMFTVEGDMSYLFKMNKIFGMAKEKYEKKYQSIENSSSMEKTFYKAKPGEIKSILAIQASPRIQNVSKTEVMLQTFLKGCKDGGAVTETVYLKDKTVNFCTGCYTCWTKTPGKCIFDDDVEEIFKKAQKADLVIYASPLYHFGIYSKLKAYIERTLIEFEPYLVENNGKTGHPLRKQYQKENNYTIIMGVCGFPELNHFELFSAHFHFLSASRYADAPKIIAEIYRPASETLGIGFYKEENKRVLAAVQKAGEEVVKSGYIKDELIKEISAIGFDADGMRNESNMFWDLCINEKKLPSQMQQEM